MVLKKYRLGLMKLLVCLTSNSGISEVLPFSTVVLLSLVALHTQLRLNRLVLMVVNSVCRFL